jgi:hypothetical protein
MARSISRGFVSQLLEAHQPSERELKEVLATCPREDQWLDYKSGLILGEKHAKSTLRKHVSGMANADGGVLVIGYDHNSHRIDGARAPNGGELIEWASKVLGPLPMAPPRITVVRAEEGDILLVAVNRSRTLVPCNEAGEFVYYYRMGDQTLRMPQALLLDLTLGQRREAELRAHLVRTEWDHTRLYDAGTRDASVMGLRLWFNIENLSFAFAEDVRIGMVAWCLRGLALRAASRLTREVDAVRPMFCEMPGGLPDWSLAHLQLPFYAPGSTDRLTLDVRALDEVRDQQLQDLPFLIPTVQPESGSPRPGCAKFDAAVYVLCKGSEPWWHQFTMEYRPGGTGQDGSQLLQTIRLEPLYGGRPRVAIEFV